MTADTSRNSRQDSRRTRRRNARKARPPGFKPRDARFRFLVEHSPDLFFSMRFPEGCFEYLSPSYETVTGFPPTDYYAEPGLMFRVIAPDWREQVAAWLDDHRQGRALETCEYQIIDLNGRTRWLHQRQVLAAAPDGLGWLLQGMATDITEHRELQAALAASEHKYRTLHEGMRDGFAVLDMDGLIVEHNSAFREMLGYSDEEISRLTYHDITPRQWHAAQDRILAKQVFLRGYSDVYEKEYIRADGTVFPVSLRSYLDSGKPGQPARIWAVVRDMTRIKQTEKELRRSEERFRRVVENTQSFITLVDGEGRFAYVNPVARQVLGLDPEDCIGRMAVDFVHPDDREQTRLAFSRWVADKLTDMSLENRLVSQSGEVRHMSWDIHCHYDADGKITLIDGIARDLTTRKRAEEALRQTNARYALLAENLVDVIWTTDARLRWTYLSPSAERMSGFPLEQLLGMRFEDLFTLESMLAVSKLMRDRQQYATPKERDRAYRLEMDLRHAEGFLVPLEVIVRPTHGPDGRINGYCGTSRDITERKLAEAALRTSEERYALALQGANDGIWDWDLVEDKVYYSDRWKEIIGFGPEELRHDVTEWTSRIHPEDSDRVLAENRRCINGEVPVFQVEYRLRHKDGSYRWIFGRGAALVGASGRVLRMAGAHTDITPRNQTEEALLKSERLSRKLLESMHGGVWAVDASRRTTFVNERLCAMLGYSSAELMNMSPLDVLEWPQRHTAEKRFNDPESGISGASDYVLIRKDGSRFPAHVMSSPIMEAQGPFEGLVCGVVDLTERARMEHELRRNQARFEALYELSRLIPATEQELAAFSLREAIRLTDSTAGVLFFVSPDGQTLVPKAWETDAFISSNLMPNFPASGPLPWAQVLHSGKPLLLNDFSEHGHLVPPGHPAVTRFLGVPALDLTRPVAVLGLTGKATPYTGEDTLQSTLLLDGMWRVVRARRDEERIRASLREKDALLHEVHHRVKNNLQVIASLLDMTGRRLTSPEARLSLSEVRGKVQAMSLIHAQLHSAVSPGGISLERFVRALFHQLQEIYAEGLDMTLQLQLGDLTLGLDQAVPLGLALNEALANVFKHACPPDGKTKGRASRVEVRATRGEAQEVTLEVRDNGPGLPAGLNPAHEPSLGMKLMFGLIRHQLRGELDFADAQPGVSVRIRFRSSVAK